MPARQSDSHRHSEPSAAPRRKSKPKFELPESASITQDVGWVYRADEELPPVNIKETVAEVAEEVRHVPAAELAAEAVLATGKPAGELPPLPPVTHEQPNATRLAVATGVGIFAIGMITTGLVTLAAFSLMAAPLRFVRSYLVPKKA